MPYTYILKCSDETFYVGSTTDMDLRFEQHQLGLGAAYTKRRLPVELVWFAEFESVADAFAFEKKLQGWSHEKRQLVIDGRWSELSGWSKRHPSRSTSALGERMGE